MDKCLGDLKDVIDGKALINAGDFKDYTTQIANGMKYLHSQNVAHRDLKPEKQPSAFGDLQNRFSVLITTESTIKICDFDRSKAFVVYMSTYAGTPLWMAPEMLTGQKYTKEVRSNEILISTFLTGGRMELCRRHLGNDNTKISV